MRYRLTSVETVTEAGSWLFTVRDGDGNEREVILVPCRSDAGPDVRAWINRCTHEDQRLHRDGVGTVVRDGDIVCPKHGSTFDRCSGACDNGPARDSTLWSVDVAVEGGDVYLTDDEFRFLRRGRSGSDDGPGSTSHLRF